MSSRWGSGSSRRAGRSRTSRPTSMWTSSRTSGRASSPCSPLTRSECASQQYNNIFDFFSYKSTKEPIYQDHAVHTTATATTTTSLSLVTSSRRGRHALYLPSQQVARDSNGKGSDDVAYQSGHRHQREGRDVGVRPGVPEHGSHQKLRRRRRARSEARTTARRRRRRLTSVAEPEVGVRVVGKIA